MTQLLPYSWHEDLATVERVSESTIAGCLQALNQYRKANSAHPTHLDCLRQLMSLCKEQGDGSLLTAACTFGCAVPESMAASLLPKPTQAVAKLLIKFASVHGTIHGLCPGLFQAHYGLSCFGLVSRRLKGGS